MQIVMIFLPVLLALFIPFLYKKITIHTGWFVLIAPVALTIYYVTKLNDPSYIAWKWVTQLQLVIDSSLDGLSLLFSILIAGIGSVVVLYSIFYLDKQKERLDYFYCYLLLFMTAMLGVVQSDHVMSLYLFWEFTSISSFLLIGYWYTNDQARFGALKSLLITVFGGLMMLGGLLLLVNMTGSWSIRQMVADVAVIQASPYVTLAIILILFGAMTKSAQFPFYIWLPDAMTAPTPVSAYLHSATMVKAGIYIVARFTPIFAAQDAWAYTVMFIGTLTLLWGSFFATKQTDLKGILAFSTVSQLGMIMAMLGVAAFSYHEGNTELVKYASFAAIFHLMNHATFKGALFMTAGIIEHETGTRDIRKLGGLMALMPLTFTVATIGALSMAGFPPLNGFLSKEMFFTTVVNIAQFNVPDIVIIIPVVAWLASIFTFVYCCYFVGGVFFGKTPKSLAKVHEAPKGMIVAPAILIAAALYITIFPNQVASLFINRAVVAIQPNDFTNASDVHQHIALWHGFTLELGMTIAVIIIGLILWRFIPKWRKVYDRLPQKWTLNGLYRQVLRILDQGMTSISKTYMTGSIRHYFIYIFITLFSVMLVSLYNENAWSLKDLTLSNLSTLPILIILVLIASTLTVLIAKTRLTAIIALGAVGYSVALLFVVFHAPDLALTQLAIETVSVALFLLVFYHLPKLNRHEARLPFKLGNFIIAAAVGVTVSLVALAAYAQNLSGSISEYYKETVYKEAGGGNIVNVILVDYRGFDTLFEITVLAIAGMAIFGMIKLRKKKGRDNDEAE